jgi:branched-chain amino acid transport system ATP-binding protein
MIRELAERKAVFIIEHRMSILLRLASRVLVMANSKLIADGTPDEIRKNKDVLRCYLGEREAP